MDQSQSEYPYDELKFLTRKHIRVVWQLAQLGGPLEEEDKRMIAVMRQHPEYSDLWGRLDELSDEEIERDGTNPILHITIHQTIENQLAEDDPQEVRHVLERLVAQGLSRHEAIHRIGSVLSEEIFYMMQDQQPYDEARYTRKLRQLVQEKKKPDKPKGRRRRRRRRRR